MLVGLHDSDRTRFPNLPLMKLSAWHKAQGHRVERFLPLMAERYDLVYSSKVFSWTPEDLYLPESAIRGGTGYGCPAELVPEIEHIMPDYSLYPDFSASLGFTTRGCPRQCAWCVVPVKEGPIRAHAGIEEFLRPDSRDVVLMDNNILAHEHGIRQLEKSIAMNLRVDCNQGLDARLISRDEALARLLAKVRWLKGPRLACDHVSQMAAVQKAVLAIRRHGGRKYDFSCYVLVKDVPDALERVEFLRRLSVKPFAQPYRQLDSKDKPGKELLRFARWVNHKAVFNTVAWKDYGKRAR